MFERGLWQIGTWRGTPVRLHWSLPIGVLVFTGFRFAPVAWLAFVALLLLHELGHAWIARRYGQHVLSIELTGFGGLCRWSGDAGAFERGVIAWGGVLAQGIVWGLTFLLVAVLGQPRSPSLAELVSVLLGTNLWLIAVNLLPVPPLDGAQAWRVLPAIVQRWRNRFAKAPRSQKASPPRSSSKSGDGDVAALLRRIGDEAGEARSRRQR